MILLLLSIVLLLHMSEKSEYCVLFPPQLVNNDQVTDIGTFCFGKLNSKTVCSDRVVMKNAANAICADREVIELSASFCFIWISPILWRYLP